MHTGILSPTFQLNCLRIESQLSMNHYYNMIMKRLSIYISVLLLMLAMLQVEGQKIKQLSLAIANETIAFPFTTIGPLHPALEGGITLWMKENGKNLQEFNAQLGWFYHARVEQAFYLKAEYGYTYLLLEWLGLDFAGGLGYLHNFYPGERYEFAPEDGNISLMRQWGKPRAMLSLGLGLSFHNESRVVPFLRQEMALESPFANGIPVMVHSFLKLGIKIKL